MDLTRAVNGYCERLGPDFWAEPVNAVSNLAFLVAAFVMWRRTRGPETPFGAVLSGVLGAIGVGSFLFHTVAQVWAAFADTLPIAGFALLYLYAANRTFCGMRRASALAATLLVVPYFAASVPLFARIPFFEISAIYWPLPVLMFGYALGLAGRAPGTARGLVISSGLLCLSLAARSLDGSLCPVWPIGTHVFWHLLNALLLGWMIELLRRHRIARLAGGQAER